MGKRDIEKGGGGEQSKGSVWIARGGGLSATAISVEGAPREREAADIIDRWSNKNEVLSYKHKN